MLNSCEATKETPSSLRGEFAAAALDQIKARLPCLHKQEKKITKYAEDAKLSARWEEEPSSSGFSTVGGGKGSAGHERGRAGSRGSVYTKEDNWDMTGKQHAAQPLKKKSIRRRAQLLPQCALSESFGAGTKSPGSIPAEKAHGPIIIGVIDQE